MIAFKHCIHCTELWTLRHEVICHAMEIRLVPTQSACCQGQRRRSYTTGPRQAQMTSQEEPVGRTGMSSHPNVAPAQNLLAKQK
jgi:hypothetical protein